MTPSTLIESVKHNLSTAQATAGMVVTHGQDLVKTGVDTLRSAQDVLAGARRDVASVVVRTRDELLTTFKEGREQIGYQLSHLATPTRKEQAQARKAEVKARKQRKRDQAQTADQDVTAKAPGAEDVGFTPPPSMDAT